MPHGAASENRTGGRVYHVTARGDRREAIYLAADDRAAWLAVFGAVCARFNWDRKRAMAQAYLSGNFTMKEIAEHFGVHYSTVSRAVRAEEEQARNA